MPIKHLNNFGKVGEPACEPVELVDHDHIHLADLDVSHRVAAGRMLHVSVGIRVVVVGHGNPPFSEPSRDVTGRVPGNDLKKTGMFGGHSLCDFNGSSKIFMASRHSASRIPGVLSSSGEAVNLDQECQALQIQWCKP